jgi:hypothetical protein
VFVADDIARDWVSARVFIAEVLAADGAVYKVVGALVVWRRLYFVPAPSARGEVFSTV